MLPGADEDGLDPPGERDVNVLNLVRLRLMKA